ncbi:MULTISPECIES: DUF6396 domain-containing protein [unclassified Neisseria]|uniref:SEL1-like repeat protein n=1 Tax=unclassified Neisseria TaxID=2623750 RepID=UPI00266618BD|nr:MULTISPECIES: DUF6396 domain-containing protein [unclassified Neisseria]MDO1509129.1 DUF6396 domain-containing protein [Neisseria sp. MVDL19-042950]MDO1516776.1 DUF6396 domain-containing protein [Neisseria sp. MVDL18-041461]MDO1564012.1 DUF6396 domain-containing protein [Neisseria sp. MVDL20-010259]
MKRSTKITLSVLALIGLALYMAYRWIACIDMGGTGQGKPDFCYNKPNWFERQQAKRETMKNIEEIKRNLEFTCVHEQRPPLSEETQQLYHYALHRDLNHMWPGERGDGFWDKLLPYYRIAAANGDYKANVRLQFILSDGWTQVPEIEAEIEVHQLNKLLQKQLPATAYYLLKGYIEDGYGVSAPPDSELAFLRKAADMGSRDAQFVLGKTLMGIDDKETLQFRLELKRKLYRCASEQGQGDASEWLGIDLQNIKQYPEAVAAFYQGVKNGNSQSALWLVDGFQGLELNLTPDAERARRYEAIRDYLSTYDFMSPKVPDLDEIVPLPPAPLPDWDGKIAFQRWVEGKEPPKPSDELMQKLADQAKLDVKTGLPIATPTQPEAAKAYSANPVSSSPPQKPQLLSWRQKFKNLLS